MARAKFNIGVYVNAEEQDVKEWLEHQDNKSRSMKLLIKQAIRQFGTGDIIDKIFEDQVLGKPSHVTHESEDKTQNTGKSSSEASPEEPSKKEHAEPENDSSVSNVIGRRFNKE